MSHSDDETKGSDTGELARTEYELAVKTQMHFNEILMKFRSFGITVVVAIYSYSVGRPSGDVIAAIGATPSQVIAVAGLILTVLLALIDLGYFFPLLLGAVDRCLALEQSTTYRLTSTIAKAVPRARAYCFVIAFYAALALSGAVLVFSVLSTTGVVAQGVHQADTASPPATVPNTSFQGTLPGKAAQRP